MEELQTLLSKLYHSQQQKFLEFENIVATCERQDEQEALQKKQKVLKAKVEDQCNTLKKANKNNKQQLKCLLDEVEIRRTQKAAQVKLLAACKEELSHLNKDISFLGEASKYEPSQFKLLEEDEALCVKYLALEIKKVTGGWLQFVFKNINRQKRDSLCVFSLKLDENRKYVVADCQPEINDLDVLVGKLNSTNNMSTFVYSVRKRFTIMVNK